VRSGRGVRQRLEDVQRAIDAIAEHRTRGPLDDPLVFDAVRMRLVEIGEAIGSIPHDVLASEPSIPWKEVVGMRHKLANHCFDTAGGIIDATVEDDLPVLEAAVERLLSRVEDRA
jgi:uncharacterized protein with HEPN domain